MPGPGAERLVQQGREQRSVPKAGRIDAPDGSQEWTQVLQPHSGRSSSAWRHRPQHPLPEEIAQPASKISDLPCGQPNVSGPTALSATKWQPTPENKAAGIQILEKICGRLRTSRWRSWAWPPRHPRPALRQVQQLRTKQIRSLPRERARPESLPVQARPSLLLAEIH